MSKFLPYEHYHIKTKLAPGEARVRIMECIQPNKPFGFLSIEDSNNTSYNIKMDGYFFEMQRIIHHRNSFLPLIKGHITQTISGETSIKITMRPRLDVIIFMSFWLGSVGAVCIVMTKALFTDPEKISGPFIGIMVPYLMFFLGWALIFFSFKAESKKSIKFLKSVLLAE